MIPFTMAASMRRILQLQGLVRFKHITPHSSPGRPLDIQGACHRFRRLFVTTHSRWELSESELVAKKRDRATALNENFEEEPDKASGKTIVKILNMETDSGVFIDAYSCIGFRLNNGMRVMGPCAIFPRSVLHWNVRGVKDISEETLTLFTLLDPKIDILVLGVGERENTAKVTPGIIKYLRTHQINVEILPTDHALATFNFLNSEKRYVAGAFIPPTYVEEDRFDDGETQFGSFVESGAPLFKTTTDYVHIPEPHKPGSKTLLDAVKEITDSMKPDHTKETRKDKKGPNKYEE